MAVLSRRINEWRETARNNPAGFVQERFRIPDTMGREVKFKYRAVQKKYSDIKREILKTGQPLRLWVIKWRRCGMSAAETAEGLAHAYGHNNARIGIIAHQENRAKELLDNYRFFLQAFETDYPHLIIPRSKDNVFGVKFENINSSVLIGTAENPIKIRGDGLHVVQGTEAAHYLYLFTRVMQELCPVVPNEAGSQIILESTGTIRGSAPFYHYNDAVPLSEWREGKIGRNEFVRVFMAFLDSPDCVKPFTEANRELCTPQRAAYMYGALCEIIEELEPRLLEKCAHYKLTPQQMNWVWAAYRYQGDNNFDYFCREFPFVESDAWSSSTSSFFGNYECDLAEKYTSEPEYHTWVMNRERLCHLFDTWEVFKKVSEVDDHSYNTPHIKVFSPPVPGQRYVLANDGASGEGGGDFTAGVVLNMHTREEMCTYHGNLRPDEAAHVNVSLCRIYNNALAAPETNPAGGGTECMNVMQRLGFHNFYVFKLRDDIKGLRNTNKIGWWTDSRRRPIMCNSMLRLFLDCVKNRIDLKGCFRDKSTLREMRTFITNPTTGKQEAMSGCKDDRVLAKAIALQVAEDETAGTRFDLLKQTYRTAVPKNKPLDQALLVSRAMTPEKAMRNFMDPRSNYNRNKFEI